MATDLEQQLVQLDELLGLLDAKALRSAQEGLENRIAELSEQLEATRQSLAQAHAQRKRLARARLLLGDTSKDTNGNGDPALHHRSPTEEPKVEGTLTAQFEEAKVEETLTAQFEEPKVERTLTAPFAVERRNNGSDRRQTEDRRSKG